MWRQFREEGEMLNAKLGEWRRHLHMYPELSYRERETTDFIASALREMGYEEVKTGFGALPTGVQTDLNGGKGGPRIALRADIDALAIREESGLPFASRNDGVMHACGHDAHAAMLLGAAALLKKAEDRLPGGVRFIFQPGEESIYPGYDGTRPGDPRSGAAFAIRSGVLEGVDAVFALHVWADLEAGVFGYAPGPTMYASSRFTLSVVGRGGHGAAPHRAVDPILAACEIVEAWQGIVSREVDAMETGLISTGTIHGGTASNVIPDRVELSGTIRSLSREVVGYIRGRMGEVAEHVAAARRCRAEFDAPMGLSPVVNDQAFSRLAAETATELFGGSRCREISPIAGSDDFSYYGERCPAAYFFLGMGT
ncbi:MAG: amidohydrolase, partial [Synergistaceae bacterium]|nr:amidohydrolase [Synergistaceae bacterium]